MRNTPAQLLSGRLRDDPSGPFITFYDDATGERIELSATTFDNWVAKTAGLLQDGLDLESGAGVRLLLPPHWQTLVWAAASWTVGGVVSVAGDGVSAAGDASPVAVVAAGPDTLDAALTLGVDDVIALSLRPLGGRFRTPLPTGVLDYAIEVPSYPDQLLVMDPPEPVDPAFTLAGVTQTLTGIVQRATERAEVLGTGPGSRLLVSTDDPAVAIIDALVVPLVVGGSVVLVRNEDPNGRDRRVTEERITVI